jgi:NitT/TauT family transport system ATP-binding protein
MTTSIQSASPGPAMTIPGGTVTQQRGEQHRPKIQLEHLHFSYDETQSAELVIEDFSLDVFDQEFVSIVGASGCGKSTLLNIIAGLLPATRGRVLIDGVEPDSPGPDRTMVFQDDAVFPWYTVEQNVEYGLRAAGMPREERTPIVEHYLELVGLIDDRDKFPRQLSGGMRKRVDVARAAAMEPEVLLMDEPFAALDVMTKERLQEEFMGIWSATRMTVIFVTHDLEEALYLSQRVVVMSRNPGRVERVVDVPLDQPRDLMVKTTGTFQNMRRELAQVLHTMQGGLEPR